MPRMNKSVILGLLVATSTVFLLFQLYYYRQYSYKPGSHFLGRTGHLSSNDVAWNTVKKFLSLAQHFNLPVFLADVASLALLSQDQPPQQQEGRRSSEPHCTVLCTGRPITSFALLANLWKYDPSLLALAEERGFDVLEVRGEDPRLASMDDLSANQIPLHFLFRHRGYVVQVTLLYERSGNYLWHGALRLKASADRTFAPFRMLDYGRHAGAYDRPTLVLTTLDGLDVRIPRNVSRFLSERHSARYVECRHREARDFYRLYPDDGGQEAIEFRRRAKSLLHLSAKTLNDLSIPFWLSSGTCLGWLRQCDIITWSRDVDLGVFARDYRPEIVAAMARAGLPLKHKFGKVGDSLELSFQGQEVKLDVFFYYEDGDIIWNGGTQARTGRKFKYVFPHFLLCWTELLDLRVRVPCEAHTVMEANYGPGWQSPVHTWDWKTSPSNVRDNGRWPPAEWDEVVQVY